MRRLPVVLALVTAVLDVTGSARAAWTWVGIGTGAAGATVLAAPGSPAAAAVAPTDSAIDVSFAVASQPPGTTYTVLRDLTTTGGPGPQVACAGLTASPCHDTGLASGTTYTYTLTAVLGGWTASAATTVGAATTGPLTITKGGVTGGSDKAKFSGTGAVAGVVIDVAVCRASGNPCTPGSPDYLQTVAFTPAANGTWGPTAPTAGKLPTGSYEAQASDGARVSALFPFVN
jgi:hypothetical protein